MPLLTLVTNLPKAQIPATFYPKAQAVVAEVLNKPLSIHVQADEWLELKGSSAPGALATFQIIGLADELRVSLAKRLTEVVLSELKVESDRFYLIFNVIKAEYVATNGVLLSEQWKAA
ncbi:hypothetical protein M3Y99_01706900 [Aphelenchoides fujianensis]|nr:hypothetical protein M3Y99_01706900 [Aphelenchoides fujianensis]